MTDKIFDDEMLSGGDYGEISEIFVQCFKQSWHQHYGNNDVDVVLSDIGLGVFKLSNNDDGSVERTKQMIPVEKLPRSLMSEVYRRFRDGLHTYKKRKEYDRFLDKVNTIVNCSYISSSKDGLIVSIENGGMGVLHTSRQESRVLHGTFPALLSKVTLNLNGFQLELDRSGKDFVIGIVKQFVPEIANGMIIIKEVARVLGTETNILVHGLTATSVIGSCIGFKGSRIKNIIENVGENVRFIEWNEDFKTFVKNFFKGLSIDLEFEMNKCYLITDSVSEAIGKQGVRIRLFRKILENFSINNDYLFVESDGLKCKDMEFVACDRNSYDELSVKNLQKVADEVDLSNSNKVFRLLFSSKGKNVAEKIEDILCGDTFNIDTGILDACKNYFDNKIYPDLLEKYVNAGGDKDFFLKVPHIPSSVYLKLLNFGIKNSDECKKFQVHEIANKFNLSYSLCSSLMDS
jgi:transcription antitermination factor NusA-like protein